MPPAASHDGAAEAYELAYDESILALGSQQTAIDNFRGRADPADIVATYIEAEKPLPVVDIRRDLALHRGSVLEENGRQFQRLVWSFRAAGILLVVEIVTWTVDLATKVD